MPPGGYVISIIEKSIQKKNIIKGTNSEIFSRTLIYIPIIHSQVDMGALSEPIRRAALQKLGEKGWKRKANLIDTMWAEIEKVMDGLTLSFEKVRLYQDGLPVCGREAEIVTELAKAGSRNHRLLLRLMERGATIMGTESSELIVEEYELVKQTLARGDTLKAAGVAPRKKALSDSLLKRRDRYIADRINGTLLPGETGILFLGMLHSLGNWLDKDIRVMYPITRPFDAGRERWRKTVNRS